MLNEKERRAFFQLRRAIDREFQPVTPRDFHNISEMALSAIVTIRYRRAQIALIKNPKCLADLLMPIFGGNSDKAIRVALDYFSVDQRNSDDAFRVMESEGLDEAQIEGHGIYAQSDKLRDLEGLIQGQQISGNRNESALLKRRAKVGSSRVGAAKPPMERVRYTGPDTDNQENTGKDPRSCSPADSKRGLSVVKK